MIGKAHSILPAGMMKGDLNGELFSHDGEEYATLNGSIVHYSDFPEWLKIEIDNKIETDQDISASLIEANILQEDMARRQVIRCLFGVFDGKADIIDGKLQDPEYWHCQSRGNCPYEGRLCKAILVHDDIYLTPREVEVLKLIDLQAKEIADRLHIAESTVPKFKQNIFDKTNMNRQGDLIKYSIRKNLIRLD